MITEFISKAAQICAQPWSARVTTGEMNLLSLAQLAGEIPLLLQGPGSVSGLWRTPVKEAPPALHVLSDAT